MPRHEEVGLKITVVGPAFFEDLPALLTEQTGYDPPELGLAVDRWIWIMARHKIIMATLIIMAMIDAFSFLRQPLLM
jgi:hypothetical protein